MNKTYMETDKNGEHKVIEQPNGIKIKLLKTPSAEYKARAEAKAIVEAENMAEQERVQAEEQLIQDRIRQIAIDQLKSEGKL